MPAQSTLVVVTDPSAAAVEDVVPGGEHGVVTASVERGVVDLSDMIKFRDDDSSPFQEAYEQLNKS